MSTKKSILHGDNFHFYSEAYDNKNIYLDLPEMAVERDDGEVAIAIPLEVWECIRQYTIADFSWADKSDDEIEKFVVNAVDVRINEKIVHPLQRFSGAGVYGLATDPREEQIEKGIAFYKVLRKSQIELRSEIEKIKKRKLNGTNTTQ